MKINVGDMVYIKKTYKEENDYSGWYYVESEESLYNGYHCCSYSYEEDKLPILYGWRNEEEIPLARITRHLPQNKFNHMASKVSL